MGLCVLYYVEYSLYNVKKVGFFYLGWNYTLSDFNQKLMYKFESASKRQLSLKTKKAKAHAELKCCIISASFKF